jgi:hypothetical protein
MQDKSWGDECRGFEDGVKRIVLVLLSTPRFSLTLATRRSTRRGKRPSEGRTALPARGGFRQHAAMTTTHAPAARSADRWQDTPAPLGATASAQVVPVTRGAGRLTRTVGVVITDATGTRWQRTPDLERLVTVATVAGSLVAATGFVASALRRSGAHVDRITMGPGGWVSFKGGRKPHPNGARRPWWAVLLRAQRLTS